MQVLSEFLRLVIAQQAVPGAGIIAAPVDVTGSPEQSVVGAKRKSADDSVTSHSSSKHSTVNSSSGGGGFGFNKNILYQYLSAPLPPALARSIHSRTDICTVIRDAYPKARTHLLVIPSEAFLDVTEVRQLTPEHAEKVAALHKVARSVAEEFGRVCSTWSDSSSSSSSSERGVMRVGYHAIPSLHPLHIHVISGDLASECLKTKKHWNSFASDYFLDAQRVEDWLRQGRAVDSQLPPEREVKNWLNAPLRCHHCRAEMKTIPALKQHLTTHM